MDAEDYSEIEGFYGILYTFDRKEGVEEFCNYMSKKKFKLKEFKNF